MAAERERRELLINVVAGLLDGIRHVAVGASSPIPAAGAMLLRARGELEGKPPVRISILGSQEHNFFTNGAIELFDCAAQGRVDAFFLGGGQIDGAETSIVGTGLINRRALAARSARPIYHLVPRVILFMRALPQVFVPKVDFAPLRPWVKVAAVPMRCSPTWRCSTSTAAAGHALRSVHPGYSSSDVRSQTGFDCVEPVVPATPLPDAQPLELLRGRVMRELAETYPSFARTMLQAA